MRDIRVAAAMMRAIVGDIAGNLARLESLVEEAALTDAEMVVFPEACLTGYTVRRSMVEMAETIPGPLMDEVVTMADKYNISICAGLVEAGPAGSCSLAQVFVDRGGIIEKYRKTHLGPVEKERFVPGDRISVFEHGGNKLGIQLCYEGHFPEMSLAQALAGVEITIIPHASPREEPQQKLDRWTRYMPARAYDNTMFLVACNQVGDNGAGLTFAGTALIAGPKGEILAQASNSEQGLIVADLKADELLAVKEGRMGYFLPLRRPDLYKIG